MINLYSRQSCSSSIKARSWFERYGLESCVKPSGKISKKKLITGLAAKEMVFYDILKNNNTISDDEMVKIRLVDKMKLYEAIDFIKANLKLLKSPIIIEKKKVSIGYNSDKIRMFLPQEYR